MSFALFVIASILIVLLIYSLVWVGWDFVINGQSYGLVTLTILVGVIWYVGSEIRKYNHERESYSKGLNAEFSVEAELLKVLGDEYAIYPDLNFEGCYGNIDFAVVGPSGVFVVEVKNNGWFVGFDWKSRTLTGNKYNKNALKTVKGRALALHKLLKAKTGADIFVKPVIIFNKYKKISFGTKPVDDVYVIGKEWINTLFTEFIKYKYPVERAVIEKELEALVQPTPQSTLPMRCT